MLRLFAKNEHYSVNMRNESEAATKLLGRKEETEREDKIKKKHIPP